MKLEDLTPGELYVWCNGTMRVDIPGPRDNHGVQKWWLIGDGVVFTVLENKKTIPDHLSPNRGGVRTEYYHTVSIVTVDGRAGTLALYDFGDVAVDRPGFNCQRLCSPAEQPEP